MSLINTKLTKAQLIEKYKELEDVYFEALDELNRLKELQEHKEGAEELKLIYDNLITAGFEEEFAKDVFVALASADRLPDVFHGRYMSVPRVSYRAHYKRND